MISHAASFAQSFHSTVGLVKPLYQNLVIMVFRSLIFSLIPQLWYLVESGINMANSNSCSLPMLPYTTALYSKTEWGQPAKLLKFASSKKIDRSLPHPQEGNLSCEDDFDVQFARDAVDTVYCQERTVYWRNARCNID